MAFSFIFYLRWFSFKNVSQNTVSSFLFYQVPSSRPLFPHPYGFSFSSFSVWRRMEVSELGIAECTMA